MNLIVKTAQNPADFVSSELAVGIGEGDVGRVLFCLEARDTVYARTITIKGDLKRILSKLSLRGHFGTESCCFLELCSIPNRPLSTILGQQRRLLYRLSSGLRRIA